ncbi:MAG: hypothetical protein DRI01_08260 [Chloroflexi bacterium]|nr:MAG: hypothetical protein DRI01_08260 [Chloroflexota bacterium]
MSIDWFRDLVICVVGLVVTGTSIFVAVLLFSLYRRIRDILDSAKATSKTIQDISSYVGGEVVKPAIELAAIIQGVRQGINTVGRFFKKTEGGRHD